MSQQLSSRESFEALGQTIRQEFKEKQYILSFDEFIEAFFRNPKKLARNAGQYVKDVIDHFGVTQEKSATGEVKRRYKVFERPRTGAKPPIVGQENAHEHIYRVLEQFVRQGRVDKLVLLHGPNGSSKSSTAEVLASALEEYSRTDEGPVYRFNWIFPNDKAGYEGLSDSAQSKQIGFDQKFSRNSKKSFAHLAENEIMCKIISEMKESPLFLVPKKERMRLYVDAVCKATGAKPEDVDVPIHIQEGALSSKNKMIYDALLVAYHGDVEKVFQHVQVERFFYSSRYRTGIAFVEPQMNVDAHDKQLTMDRNIQNIPSVLQNIRMFEPSGDLIDANRGFIEFSDLLKRPLEAFKYLLTTIEKMNLSLTSGIVDLDMVMIGSTNEKHLDAFKASPDWPSFKGRFELVRVPYLLSSKLEQRIYEEDVRIISRTKKVGPHAVELMAKWAVLTRLKQPDPDFYDFSVRGLVSRLDPYEKLALYDGDDLSPNFNETEKSSLKKIAAEIKKESQLSIAYEGRFGASPREMKMLLYFAAQESDSDSFSALRVFDEIERLTRDRSVYDFLQFEPRAGYHDYNDFLKYVRGNYIRIFYKEFLSALNLFDENQYVRALHRYLRNVVAFIKKERIENELTGKLEDPSESAMDEIENLLGATDDKRSFREKIVAKMASWRVENPKGELDIHKVFALELETISRSIYDSKVTHIERVRDGMLMWGSEDYEKLQADTLAACEQTFQNLEKNYGYTKRIAWETLVFMRNFHASR